jgi:hypothetical protein
MDELTPTHPVQKVSAVGTYSGNDVRIEHDTYRRTYCPDGGAGW